MTLITRLIAVVGLCTVLVQAAPSESAKAVARGHRRGSPARHHDSEFERDLPSLVPRTIGPPSKKKAITYTSGSAGPLAALKGEVSILLNWSDAAPYGLNYEEYGLEFACQFWGAKTASSWKKNAPKCKYMLGPNEFNLGQPSGSGLSPGAVASLWDEYIDEYCSSGKAYCVAPSVTSAPSGFSQLAAFFKECKGHTNKCHVKAVSAHIYDISLSKMTAYLESMYKEFGLPIWVTEFGCQSFAENKKCSASEAATLMKQFVQWCKETEWIILYAPFGLMPPSQVEQWGLGGGSALLESNGKTLSSVGEAFLKS